MIKSRVADPYILTTIEEQTILKVHQNDMDVFRYKEKSENALHYQHSAEFFNQSDPWVVLRFDILLSSSSELRSSRNA